MTGADDLWQATVIQDELIEICRKGDFHLHKWCSNHPLLLENIPKAKQEVSLDINAEKTETKALGMKWIPKTDFFMMHYQPTVFKRITKRTVLSETAQLFDPLGLVNPVIVVAKIFLQELWALKLDWDAALPMELHTKWDNFREDLLKLNNVSVKRHLVVHDPVDIQLHAFSDASTRAYGTAMYLRSISSSGEIQVNLICSKSRVAPVAATTLPRLELCAGMIMTELAEKLQKVLGIEVSQITYWTDSELVLSWIYRDGTYKTFVANRVAAIRRKSRPEAWKYINTKLNPADLISRGVFPDKLIESDLWWHGPGFLRKTEEHWPLIKPAFIREPSEERTIKTVLTTFQQEEHFIDRINHRNSFSTLQRVVAYVMRFRAQQSNQSVRSLKEKPSRNLLSTNELQRATVAIIKYCQEQAFAVELAFVQKGLGERTKYSNFVQIIDADGVLGVGGRLQSANVPFEQKHPALLPKDHFVTRLKRFIARRGIPRKIFCDNATNFVGASNQLAELKKKMDDPEHQSEVIRYCQDHQIEWKFIPPRIEPEASTSQQVTNGSHSKPSKSQKKLNPAAQSFVSLFTALILGAIGEPCDVMSFKSNPGIYFVEEQIQVSLTSDDWTIVCYAQLENYWNQYLTIKSLLERLDEMCPQLSSSEYCDITRKQMRAQLLTIQNKNELIKGFSRTRKRRAWSIEKIDSNTLELSEAIEYEKIINKLKQKTVKGSIRRQNRGWINPIGYGLKAVTGVLDDNDGKRYDDKIENLNLETKHLLQLIGNQTTIQEITQNIIKRDETGMARTLKKIENEIDALRNQDEARKAETFNALALQAVVLINSHTIIQSDILDMIIETHHGKVSTNILTPTQLRQHMQIIASNISKELMIPGDDNTENIARVYAILTVKVRVTTSRIIFKITMPLLHREFFKLYYLIPIPFVYSNLTLNIIQTNYQYIGVNYKQDNYFLLSHQQRSDCKAYSEELLICEQNHPVFNTYGGEALCEMAIFSHQTKKIPPKCITKQILGKQLWSKINSPNKFLFTMVEPSAVNFICKENTSVCTLEGVGIISLPQECILQSGNLEIAAHNNHNSEIPVLFVPGINITDVLHEEYKPRNTSQHIRQPIYEFDADLDVLSSALQTQRFNENFTPTSINWHDVHHYTCIYIIILLTIFCMVFYIYKTKSGIYHRKKDVAKKSEMPATTQPIPAVHPRILPPSAMTTIETIDSVSFG